MITTLQRKPATGEFRVGECVVDRGKGTVTHTGGVRRVEPRVMDVLVALAERAGRTVSRDELILAVWGHRNVSDEALSRHVCLLRQVLGDARAAPRFVETIPKRGYRMLADVCGLTVAAPACVAVLPFLNLTGDARNEHFADSLTELVIACLADAPAPGLRVVSRTSSMSYKKSCLPLPQIARAIGVGSVAEGSLIARPRGMQAVVQLIDAAADTHVLCRSYHDDGDDPLQFQDRAATAIAQLVRDALATERHRARS